MRTISTCAAGVLLVVFSTWSALGLAQVSRAAPTPPIAQGSTEVPYPPGAKGEARVDLELVVARDGSVSSAVVVEGSEPFAEHARRAVLTWRFVPAYRDGTPVSARIRARIAFHQELPRPAASEAVGSTTRRPATPAPRETTSEPPIEVLVLGARREIGETTLSASEVREMPGAFGDAFRAVEALPGVAPLVSGIPYFYVRGAPPNNSGYYLDGVRIPLLFHVGIGQSVLHPGLIQEVAFFPGAAPARYGGVTGAVISGQSREPARTLHGEANLRLVDAGALLEAPFASGRGTALVAGRYGYPGPILSAITDEVTLGYWDYQARATFRVGARDTLGVFAFGSHDYLARASPSLDPQAAGRQIEEFVSDFHRLDLRYDRALVDGRVRLAVTAGYDSQGAEPTYVTDRSIALRMELEQSLSSTLRLHTGASAELDEYRLNQTARGPGEPVVPASADPAPTNVKAGVHVETVWRPTRAVELVPGARFDVFTSFRANEAPSTGRTDTLAPAVDPRLSARVVVAPGLAWLSTFALSHQYPSLRVGTIPAPVLSVPGFPFGNQQLQTAARASEGIEVALPAEMIVTATGFYSHWWGLTDLSAECVQVSPPGAVPPMAGVVAPPYVCPSNRPVQGRAYGLELLVRRRLLNRLSGWLSYTLSRATRKSHFPTPDGADTVANTTSAFDRTHVLNAVLAYELGRRWRVGGRFLFYTGTPYSKLEGSLPVAPYNGYRNPPFFRVDVRLEKRWRVGQTGSIAFVLEGQNVTLSKEVSALGLDCDEQHAAPGEIGDCKQPTIGPVTIPSVGVEAFF